MKTLQLLLISFFTLSISVSSCKKDDTPVTPPPPTNYPAREEMNVSYGNDQRNKMDVYFPEGYNESTPVVFLIHGGGFIGGSKEEFTPRAQTFREQGFIAVNLSYRLIDTAGLFSLPPVHAASDVKISDQLADVHAAVLEFVARSSDWHAGTEQLYVAGHSAGAVLSMLYTQGDYNNDSHIRACGNWAGITDFSFPWSGITEPGVPVDSLLDNIDPRYLELLYRATGAVPNESNSLYLMAISPYWVAYNNDGKPNISIYPENNVVLNVVGEAEWGLHYTQEYHLMLRNKGVAEKLTIYSGDDHGFSQSGSWDRLIKETADFFRQN